MARHPATDPKTDDKVFVILGWFFIALALFYMPVLFAPSAMVMGIIAYLRGGRLNGVLIVLVAAVILALYLLLGALLTTIFLSHPELTPFHTH